MREIIAEIEILEWSTGKLIPASLEKADAQTFAEVDASWTQSRVALLAQQSGGLKPEHMHWSWTNKAPLLSLLAYKAFCLVAAGEFQGVILLLAGLRPARLAPHVGKPLVYVDYVESAPWNLKLFTDAPRYKAVGISLIQLAVGVSFDEGFSGRVGLHSLPQSEFFYRTVCEMTDLGPDPQYHNLRYFEFTEDQAAKLIQERSDNK